MPERRERTEGERSLIARIAASERWAVEPDRRAATAAARAASPVSITYFEKQVDPDGVLTASERQRRAESARKAHYARLALASAKARRARSS